MILESNPDLHKTILAVVDKQITENNPRETAMTFERLVREGYSESEAKNLIGKVVYAELFDILKKKQQFNLERYVGALQMLPDLTDDIKGEY